MNPHTAGRGLPPARLGALGAQPVAQQQQRGAAAAGAGGQPGGQHLGAGKCELTVALWLTPVILSMLRNGATGGARALAGGQDRWGDLQW